MIVKNSNPEKKEKFLRTVEKTLRDLADKGIDRRLIEAAINRKEFALRESEMPKFPKGLVIGMRMLDSWAYGADPHLVLEIRTRVAAHPGGRPARLFRATDPPEPAGQPLPGRRGPPAREGPGSSQRREVAGRVGEAPRLDAGRGIGTHQAINGKAQVAAGCPDRPEDLATIPTLRLSDLQRAAEKLPLKPIQTGRRHVPQPFTADQQIAYVGLYFDAAALCRRS